MCKECSSFPNDKECNTQQYTIQSPKERGKKKKLDKMTNRSMSLSNKANKPSPSHSVLSELFIVFVSKYRPEMH